MGKIAILAVSGTGNCKNIFLSEKSKVLIQSAEYVRSYQLFALAVEAGY